MSFCALCQCKSYRKLKKDIVVDTIGDPPILLCELLLKITIDLDYKLATTELCNKCTNKLGRYYKSIQLAEQIRKEIIETIQNQIQIYSENETETHSMENLCLTEDLEVIEASEIVYTKNDEENETNLPDNEIQQNTNNYILEDAQDDEFIDSILKEEFSSDNENANISKSSSKRNSNKSSGQAERTNKVTSGDSRKKSVDCSKSKGVFMYSAGEVGEPLGIRCEICDRVFKYSRTFYAHKKYKDFAGYVCEICGITCLTKVGIKDHAKVHNPDKEFQCPQCNAQFHRKLLFEQHMAYHTDERPFKCEVCSKSFAHRIALKVHMKIHTDDYRRIECEFCDKKFRTLTHKRRHMPIHTGAKPFTCRFCGNRFSQADNMRAHMKLRHKFVDQKDSTTPQPLNCQNCCESFKNLLEFEEHTKTCS